MRGKLITIFGVIGIGKIMIKKLNELWERIPQECKYAFKCTMIIGLIVHLFMLTNKLPNHDDMGQMYDAMERSTSARWFLYFPAAISGNLSIVFAGILGIIYISIGVSFLVAALKVKTKIAISLMSGLMVAFPTIASTLSYMNSADGYFFALMLASIAIYLAVVNGKISWIVSVVCLTLSLGIYQAYFPYAIAMLVVVHVLSLVADGANCLETIKKGLRSVSILFISLITYMLKVKFDQVYNDLELTSYKGINEMGKISFSELPQLISDAYNFSLGFFWENKKWIHWDSMQYVFVTATIAMFVIVLYLVFKSKKEGKIGRIILIAALFLVLPLAAGSIYIMVAGSSVHILMVYAYLALLILPIALVDRLQFIDHEEGIGAKIWRIVLYLSESIIIFMACSSILNYAILSNQAYLQLFLAYEQSYAYSNRLIYRIEEEEGFTSDKRIVLVGTASLDTNTTMQWRKTERQLRSMMGIDDTYVDVSRYNIFLTNYLGVEQEIIAAKNIESLKELGIYEDIGTLPIYPNDGAIIIKDDMVIVKFSDIEE